MQSAGTQLTSPDCCCLHVLCYVMVSTITSSSPPAGWDQTRLQTQRSCAASGDTAPIRQLAPPQPRPGDTASASPPAPLCRDTRLFPSVYFSHPLTSPSLPPNPPHPHIPQVRANTVRECHYHDRVAPLLQCRVPQRVGRKEKCLLEMDLYLLMFVLRGNDLISNNAKNLCCNNHNKGMKGATSNIVLYNFNRLILHFIII